MGSLSQCWGLSWKTKGNRWEETENNSWVRTRLGRREAVFCQQPCYNTAPCSLPLMNSFSSIRLPRCVILKQCIMQTDRDKAKVDAIWECVCVCVRVSDHRKICKCANVSDQMSDQPLVLSPSPLHLIPLWKQSLLNYPSTIIHIVRCEAYAASTDVDPFKPQAHMHSTHRQSVLKHCLASELQVDITTHRKHNGVPF